MSHHILGIDVSKAKLDVALSDSHQIIEQAVFSNDRSGFKKLNKWLTKRVNEPLWACMEATGQYGEAVAHYLYQQGHRVSVVNPARIKKYAQSKLQRAKTDPVDARLIADFCLTQRPPLWNPPSPQQRELQALTRRLAALIEAQTREKNRLQSGLQSEAVIVSIQTHLDFLADQIAQLEQHIQHHIDQHPSLKQKKELLLSIPGIGQKTASRLLGELPDVVEFDSSAQVVAYVGLCPQPHHSGSSIHKRARLTKIGKHRLKAALYFPALTAIRLNPIVTALADRLKERGKHTMVIVGAAMRKLIQLAYGVLKSGRPFDPNFAVNLHFTA